MQKLEHFAYREVVKGGYDDVLIEYIGTKPQKIRAFGYNMLSVLDVAKITKGAYGIAGGVNNITVTSEVVVASHELVQFSPLGSVAAQNFPRASFVNCGKPLFGLPTFLRIPESLEENIP